ncbi:sensor histidine kinase [Isoalcanivorax beigongshangi]|uniref:histidine kinase n=1 Tax=Isoalcanivorax beigongshangi TaxID=3238810 RepID=A0ABV4AIQ1_9GAMM
MTSSWHQPRTWRRRLLLLRAGLITVLALVFWVADLRGVLPLPTLEAAAWLVVLWLPSIGCVLTWQANRRWQERLLAVEASADMVLFLGLLHQLGGAANPLAYYLLVPVTLAALSLPLRIAAPLSALAIAGYGFTLHWYGEPLDSAPLHALTQDIHPHHGLGMWLAFGAVALVLTGMGQLLRRTLRQEARSHSRALDLALQRERMYQVAASLADHAHELNTPLSTLLLLSESLADNPALPDDARSEAMQIGELARRVSQRLRPPATPAAGDSAPQSLSKLCQGLAHNLRHLAPTLRVHFSGPEDPLLPHPVALQRVLTNLGYNACDAGARTLDVACSTAGEHWLLQLSDDGPRSAVAPERAGLGIGLTLVETTLSALGGRLELEFARQWTQARILLPKGEHP